MNPSFLDKVYQKFPHTTDQFADALDGVSNKTSNGRAYTLKQERSYCAKNLAIRLLTLLPDIIIRPMVHAAQTLFAVGKLIGRACILAFDHSNPAKQSYMNQAKKTADMALSTLVSPLVAPMTSSRLLVGLFKPSSFFVEPDKLMIYRRLPDEKKKLVENFEDISQKITGLRKKYDREKEKLDLTPERAEAFTELTIGEALMEYCARWRLLSDEKHEFKEGFLGRNRPDLRDKFNKLPQDNIVDKAELLGAFRDLVKKWDKDISPQDLEKFIIDNCKTPTQRMIFDEFFSKNAKRVLGHSRFGADQFKTETKTKVELNSSMEKRFEELKKIYQAHP